ncbi:MAG: hypothetical protein ACKO97_10690, partial [Actinomycetota bacterium]
EAKPTPMMALALQRANSQQQLVLKKVGNASLSPSDIADVQQAIVDSGALSAMETTISDLRDEAISAIGRAPIDAEVQTQMVELAHFVTDRKV